VSYGSDVDGFCYPETNVLRNKADIEDQNALDAFELEMVLVRSKEQWPAGNLDVSHYCSLHHHLFQDVYEWAGTLRTVRIGKAGVWFCYPEHIKGEMTKLFDWLKNEDYFHSHSGMEFSVKAVRLLSELNAIHPFREGNGRTQMSLLTILVDKSGLPFNITALEPKRSMDAMIDSFKGNLIPLQELIADLVRR
jgi:cell filamentation protein